MIEDSVVVEAAVAEVKAASSIVEATSFKVEATPLRLRPANCALISGLDKSHKLGTTKLS